MKLYDFLNEDVKSKTKLLLKKFNDEISSLAEVEEGASVNLKNDG